MNWRLVIASLLALLTAAIHIFWGGQDVAGPLLTSTLAVDPKLTLYAVWHMASCVLAFSAIALFIGSLPKYAKAAQSLVYFISILWLSFAIIFLVIALVQPENGWFLKLPQWILLAPVGFLGLWRFGKKKVIH